ncbi:quorum-sensing sensor histidine kinase AgrC [Staphylococcus sp. Marseille-Q5304]|uniref:quorum-sensing sensor histidine kinase AgrC n=1 Tax=Staphylococcus sp. Marseille-Q5304 TaxID=2942200 RepID=UPI0020745180|nr:GHKL domain-containing protein [Staphylococcus sp. Marseille-Q5304]
MAILDSIFLIIFQSICPFILIKILNKINYTLRDYISILGIIIPSNILFCFIEAKAMIVLLVGAAIFMYLKNKMMGILSVLISFFILYMTNFVTIWLGALFFVFVPSNVLFSIIYVAIFLIFSISTAYIARYFLRTLITSGLSVSKIYLSIVASFLFIVLLIICFYLPNKSLNFGDLKFLVFIGAMVIIALAIIVITISFSIVRQIQYKRNMQEIDNYYKYTLQIEKINNEMRKFRHDYVNILSTMSDFIREDDMKGLRTYFNEEILPMQDSMQMNAIKINGIENLKVREIKGLLTTKILQAQEKDITINIEVPDEIDHINMRKIDLSRIIGIILDNAIEASEKIEEEPLIRLAFIKNEATSVTLIVMNKCESDMPRLHTLFQQNFSTKGKNRGLGLSTLKEITDETPNVLLDTTIDANYFIQKVEILNS